MTVHRRHPFFTFFILLLFSAIACQGASTLQTAAEIDTDAVVERAVATIQAETPAISPTTVDTSSAQIAPVSLDLQTTLIEVYKRINPAVVHIFVFGQGFEIPLGSGSGFVYDEIGHIVTNNHVVTDGTSFEVAFADGSRRKATLVGTDVDSDLAVIEVESLPPDITPVRLSDSSQLEVGQFVIAIGNPFGETGSMSIGIISGLGRTLDSQRSVDGGGRYSLPQVIQTDAAINPGNSGGPLLNLTGEVIGVNSAILTRSGTNSGVGFSIPVNAVSRIVPALVADGKYVYPFMGISMDTELDLTDRERLGLPTTNGVYVTSVGAGTPAEAAGLIGSGTSNGFELNTGGDLITAIDGHPLRDSSDLISYLVFETTVGQTIELTVIRDNQELTIPLTLGARP